MEVVGIAIALGVIVSVASGGRISGILDAPIRGAALAFAAVAVQLLLGLWAPPGGWSEALARALLVLSTGALAGFCIANLRLTGMSVVLVGVTLNWIAVVVNGAMPVRIPTDASATDRAAVERSATRIPEDQADVPVLGQTIPLPGPAERSVSFGDLIVSVGLVDVLVHLGRRRRRGARDSGDAPARPPESRDDAPLEQISAGARAHAGVRDAWEASASGAVAGGDLLEDDVLERVEHVAVVDAPDAGSDQVEGGPSVGGIASGRGLEGAAGLEDERGE